MGFLYQAIKLPNAITLTFFLNIITQTRFILISLLTRLGLYKHEQQQQESSSNSNNYILIFDGNCPSFIPIPIHVVTAAIKRNVPILKFRDLIIPQLLENEIVTEEESHQSCRICLECVELDDEVRELCKCSHVFHKDCLDTWIDEGQVTCPLCRSMMLPPKTNLHTSSTNMCNTTIES